MTARTRGAIAVAAIGLLVALAVPARAHTASTFYPRKWPTAKVTYSHTSSVPSNWRPLVDEAAGRWNRVKDAELDFVRGSDSGDYDWAVCSGKTGIHRDNSGGGLGSPGGVLGVTVVCYQSSSSTITSANVAFDSSENWYAGTGSPSSNQMDLLSVATHELGHATGFANHFDNNESICANNSDMQTMCPSYTVGTTWARSLEKHDKHTMKGAY